MELVLTQHTGVSSQMSAFFPPTNSITCRVIVMLKWLTAVNYSLRVMFQPVKIHSSLVAKSEQSPTSFLMLFPSIQHRRHILQLIKAALFHCKKRLRTTHHKLPTTDSSPFSPYFPNHLDGLSISCYNRATCRIVTSLTLSLK